LARAVSSSSLGQERLVDGDADQQFAGVAADGQSHADRPVAGTQAVKKAGPQALRAQFSRAS
jgi:hypothetical protein